MTAACLCPLTDYHLEHYSIECNGPETTVSCAHPSSRLLSFSPPPPLSPVSTTPPSLLVKAGADVNACDRWGSTPLWEAVQRRRKAVIDVLLQLNARIGKSPERLAAHMCTLVQSNMITHLSMLLSVPGVDPSAGEFDGRTPLHVAVEEGRVDAVKLLVEAQADPMAEDRWGNTPTRIATAGGKEHILKMFKEQGC